MKNTKRLNGATAHGIPSPDAATAANIATPEKGGRIMTDEKRREYHWTYHERHKDDAAYRERRRLYAREYYRKNRERCMEYSRKYYAAHPEKYRELHRKYYAEHRAKPPEGCVYPDCFHCPLPDCVKEGV